MTKLADLAVTYRCDGCYTTPDHIRSVTVDDLVEVLADPEVQKMLGAAVRPSVLVDGGYFLVVPLSRLEDTDGD